MKYVILCLDSPPGLVFRCDRYSSCRCEERANRDFLHVSIRNATNITHIANWRVGQNSTQKLNISYIDQFVVPPIFNYLIGAKDVDSRNGKAGHPWFHRWPGSTIGEHMYVLVYLTFFSLFLLDHDFAFKD